MNGYHIKFQDQVNATGCCSGTDKKYWLTVHILAHQSLTISVNKKGSGKMLSITLLPIAGLSGRVLEMKCKTRVLEF